MKWWPWKKRPRREAFTCPARPPTPTDEEAERDRELRDARDTLRRLDDELSLMRRDEGPR